MEAGRPRVNIRRRNGFCLAGTGGHLWAKLQPAAASSGSTPYSTTVAQIQSAAASLVQTNLTIATSVQGASCTGDSGCLTALKNAYPGGSASVTVTYPCPLILSTAGLQWLGINTTFCPLTSTVTEYVM